MVLNKIKDEFKKHMNHYYRSINNRWYLPDDEKLKIAEYIKNNENIVEPYFITINRETIDKILDSIEQFAHLKGSSIDLHTTSQYFDMLENLDKTIEKIENGFFNSLPKYNNVAKPKQLYMELSFDIGGNPENERNFN
jgi:hypothetical protein